MLAQAAAVLLAAAIGLLFWLHWAEPTLSPLHDAVSLYGAAASAAVFRAYAHLGTAGIALFSLQWYLQRPQQLTPVVAASLIVLLVARLAVAAVPTDAKGQPSSGRGRVHLALAITVFTATYTTIENATPAFASRPFSTPLLALRWLCMGCLAAVVVTMLLPRKRLFGLAERGFLLSALSWFLVSSLSLAAARSAA